MLLSLHVKNLALIDEIEVNFFDHLNILTGETGAGKSIIIGSIKAALGAKVSKEMIRPGKEYALIELLFHINDPYLIKKLKEKDVYLDEEQLLISRKIMENRSVCKINGETVTLAFLKEIAADLLDLHGQHEHQSLLRESSYLDMLDRYASDKLEHLLEEMKIAYEDYRKVKKEYEALSLDVDKRNRDLEFLQYEIDEIEKAKLVSGEDEKLELFYKRQNNSRQMMEALSLVHGISCEGAENSISDMLGQAIRGMALIEDIDDTTKSLYGQLTQMEALLSDFNRELSDYMDEMIFDEEAYKETEERLNLINHLKSRYGNTIEDILEYYDKQCKKMEKLQNYEEYQKKITKEYEEKRKQAMEIARKISGIRKESAKQLEKEMVQSLCDLNFLRVECEMQFEELTEVTVRGIDRVSMMISTNPGQPMRPLNQVASGGELARIMLALKATLAKVDKIPTLIFDEIDTGVSGRTAQMVAEKMVTISKDHQVICITHLPQIAAMADCHYLIEKKVEKGTTTTDIRLLNMEQEVKELARLLGGVEITDTILKSAKEMKDLARTTKSY